MVSTQHVLDQLIDYSPVSVQVLNRTGMTVRVNDAFLRLFGFERPEQVVGVINVLTNPVVKAHGLVPFIERAFQGEVVHTPPAPWISEFGPPRDIQATIFPVKAEDGTLENVVLLHEDVTRLQASEQELSERYRQVAALQEAYRNITSDLSTTAVQRNILEAMASLVPADGYAIWRLDSATGTWRCAAARGLSEEFQREVVSQFDQSSPSDAELVDVLEKNRPVIAEDIRTSPLLERYREAHEREGISRLLLVPLKSGRAVIGSMTYCGREAGKFRSTDVDAAILLADQAAIAFHNADLYERAREAASEALLLSESASILARSLSLPEVLRALTETVAPLMGMRRVAVHRINRENSEVQLVAYTGLEPEQLRAWNADAPTRFSDLPAATRHMVETGEPLVYDEIPEEMLAELAPEQRKAIDAFGIRSILVVPLREGGRTIGYMSFDEPQTPHHWTERDLRLARGVADQVAAAIRNARLYQDAQEARETLEERVRERSEELKTAHSAMVANERLAAVGFMSREVAHGLRNPLNVISTSMYYIRSRFPNPDEKVLRNFETISRYVESAANTINQLMNLAGSRKPEMGPVDLNQLVQRALQDRFTAEELQWHGDWAEDLPLIRGDWNLLSHAVKALITNAASTGDGAVCIRTERDDGMAVLAVGDRRRQLSEEDRQALFEPFSTSATHWTGLGLSVARQIAVKHGGDLTVDEANDLTWFRMALPILDEETAAPI